MFGFYIWVIVTLVSTFLVNRFYKFMFEIYKRSAARTSSKTDRDKFIEKRDRSLDRALIYPVMTSFVSIISCVTVVIQKPSIATEFFNTLEAEKLGNVFHGLIFIAMFVYSLIICILAILILYEYLMDLRFKIITNIEFKNPKEMIINSIVNKVITSNTKAHNNSIN